MDVSYEMVTESEWFHAVENKTDLTTEQFIDWIKNTKVKFKILVQHCFNGTLGIYCMVKGVGTYSFLKHHLFYDYLSFEPNTNTFIINDTQTFMAFLNVLDNFFIQNGISLKKPIMVWYFEEDVEKLINI